MQVSHSTADQEMDSDTFKALMDSLTDPTTKRLSLARIAALSADQKSGVVGYLIGQKRPIIAGFITDQMISDLTAADYTSGWHNAHFDFWIRPQHAQIFTQRESTYAVPAAEKRSDTSFLANLHQAIDAEMKPGLDSDKSENEHASDKGEWNGPQPIETHLLSVLSVTPTMIPEPLRPWLCDLAYRLKCPLDFVVSTAIVMLSSLIGTRLTIRPKIRDDWSVVPNLWGAIIGGPSTKKSPSMSQVLKPLYRLVTLARADFDASMAQFERAEVDYEVQKKAYIKQEQGKHDSKRVETMVSYPEAPEKPIERRYMVNDTTVEKLAELLNDNPTGLLQLRDELIGLLASWDRSGHEQDRAFHLEAWNGNGSMTIDRISRGTMHVPLICESLFGGIQPAKLLPYLQAATGYENDGFVQRLQVAVYPDPIPWDYSDEYPDKVARDRAFALIQKVANSNFESIRYDADEYEQFPYTRFDSDAQDIFKDWLIEWETNVLPNESGLLQEHFAKFPSLMPSLALIFHVVDCAESSVAVPTSTNKRLVSADAARMAVCWCEYLMSHAKRIYGLLDTVNVDSARELLRRLKKRDLDDGFKLRDVYRKKWSHLTTPELAEAAVSELVVRHYLEEVMPSPKPGRPEAPHYLINPKIYQKA